MINDSEEKLVAKDVNMIEETPLENKIIPPKKSFRLILLKVSRLSFWLRVLIEFVVGMALFISFVFAASAYLKLREAKINYYPNISSLSKPTEKPIEMNPTPTPNCKNGDLKIFKDSCGVYYTVGTIPNGKYEGYKRIVAEFSTGMGEIYFLLATADDNKYILNGDPQDAIVYPETNSGNPYYYFDKAKISAIDDLASTSHPQTITINNNFALFREDIFYDSIPSKTSNSGSENKLITDFSSYTPLSWNNSDLKFYIKKYEYNISTDDKVKENYFNTNTRVIVIDKNGLGYWYIITNPQTIAEYPHKIEKFRKDYIAYTQNNNPNDPNTWVSPDYPATPGLSFAKDMVATNQALYQNYGNSFPRPCGQGEWIVAKNLQDNNLIKIGTLNNGIDLFVLSDKNHDLLKLVYKERVQDNTNWNLGNTLKIPTYDQYVSQNPLIFFKDPWGRWIITEEGDYHFYAECGKPVIYLYPPKPMEVTVKFLSPMKLDVSIPNYNNGWDVLAFSDGSLKDLQSGLTDCQKIDFTRKGSEFAKEACATKTYPYLYWEGQSLARSYPHPEGGWIVVKSNLFSFMNKKLDEVGLNEEEKSEMLSYWVPEILQKNAPYYKISFLQTREMNYLVPMDIRPIPDTVFRIFLDYEPLWSKTAINIVPQALIKLQRIGFTVVEWGGTKR